MDNIDDQYEEWERNQLVDELFELREDLDILREALEYGLREDGLIPRVTSEYRKRIHATLRQIFNG